MNTAELRDSIIQKVLHTNDQQLLDYLNQLLTGNQKNDTYKLSEFEKSVLHDSHADYNSGKTITNDEVFNRNEKWLKK